MDIQHKLYIEHLGVAGALAVSVFVLLGLLMRLCDSPGPRMHIWAMIAFFLINICDGINSLAYSDVFSGPMALYRWNDVIIAGFMVSLYLFVRALTSAAPALTRADFVHLVPFAVAILCLSPALVLPGNLRRDPELGGVSDLHLFLIDTGETAFWIVWVVILVIYGGICVRRLVVHKRNIRAVFSDLEGKTLRWLDALVGTILFLAGVVILDEIGQLFGFTPLRDGIWSLLYDTALPIFIGLFALRANPPLPEWSDAVLKGTPQNATDERHDDSRNESDKSDQTDPPERAASRYARSGLTEADVTKYADRLERRMAEGQLWRNHSLNLRGLAAEIAIPAIHLSEVLNTRLGMSFYDYVNQCRIRDACDLLIHSNDTILDISETVGFNAKSTFNTSFKKLTDQTPSQWRAKHKP